MQRIRRELVFALVEVLWLQVAAASPPAFQEIGKKQGIPGDVLYALALTESGRALKGRRQIVPWPWTLNIAGKSHYYNSKKAACSALKQAVEDGKQVDAGFMQVNWYHNGRHMVKAPCDLLSPWKNITLGARILARERRENGGSLFRAIGTYHTGSENTPERAKRAMRYRLRVAKHYSSLKKK
ncbi:transglycosylase SLT domain-containing protein [Thiolapillus sp.]|uniref:transglycosylase SLT domain-containing protein n=1 Tax=Thiolapillus sp. TaxID=2017437 RepID=UPI003AF53053